MPRRKTESGQKKTGARKGGKKKAGGKKASGTVYIVSAKAKAMLKGEGFDVSVAALGSLNSVVLWYLQQAAQRAGAKSRKRINAQDFKLHLPGGFAP